MPAPVTLAISQESQKLICDFVDSACQMAQTAQRRSYMEWMDRQYARKLDASSKTFQAQLAALKGDPTKYRNIIYPLVMPQIEAAVGYQMEVYCSGSPLFPVIAPPQYLEAAQQLETLIDRDAQKGGWASEFTLSFRDAFKYNLCGLHTSWEVKLNPVDAVGTGGPEGNQRQIAWQGNTVRRLDMYNTYIDPRVLPSKVAEQGEFALTVELMSRTRLRTLVSSLPTKLTQNLAAAYASGSSAYSAAKFFVPNIGTSLYAKAVAKEFSWGSYLQLASRNSSGKQIGVIGDMFQVLTGYIRVCPVDLKLDKATAKSLPQVFKVIVVNDRHLIHFAPVDSNETNLPMLFAQAYDDGLGLATNSMVEDIEGMQSLASAFLNSAVAARRRAVGDRAIYNQMLIDPRDIDSDNPVAKIPMKPSALLNRSATEAYYPIPFRDEISSQAIQEAESIANLGFMVTGQNKTRQGQFVKGNKTKAEFSSVMDASSSRDRAVALHFETRLFTPIKNQLRYNVLRQQGAETIFNMRNQQATTINPQALRDAVMEFQVGDGLSPAAKLADADTLQVMLQTIPALPQLAQEYNLADVFAQLIGAGGIKVKEFRYSPEQVQYNQALAAWQQAAAQAAAKGVAFSTPMPQAPGSQNNAGGNQQ